MQFPRELAAPEAMAEAIATLESGVKSDLSEQSGDCSQNCDVSVQSSDWPEHSGSVVSKTLTTVQNVFSIQSKMDYVEMRRSEGLTTSLQTGSSAVTAMIGAGILGFPATFAKAGWIGSFVILGLAAWTTIEMVKCLDKAALFVEARIQKGELLGFTRPRRLDDLSQAAFGLRTRTFVTIFVNWFMLMIGVAFVILISDSIYLLFPQVGNKKHIVLGLGVLFGPLALVDDMSLIAKLSFIGVLASVLYVVSIGISGVKATSLTYEQPKEHMLFVSWAHFTELGLVVSVFLNGFTVQTVAVTLRAEMEKPRQFSRVVSIAVCLVTFVYAVAGALAYWGWGSTVCGNVNQSMVYPSSDGGDPCREGFTGVRMALGNALSVGVIANLVVTFPIFMNVVYRAAEVAIRSKYSVLLRWLILAVVLLISAFLPFFLPFFGLLSAVFGIPVGIFLPIVLYWRLNNGNGPPPSKQRGLMLRHFLIIFLGSVGLVFGTWDASKELLAALAQ